MVYLGSFVCESITAVNSTLKGGSTVKVSYLSLIGSYLGDPTESNDQVAITGVNYLNINVVDSDVSYLYGTLTLGDYADEDEGVWANLWTYYTFDGVIFTQDYGGELYYITICACDITGVLSNYWQECSGDLGDDGIVCASASTKEGYTFLGWSYGGATYEVYEDEYFGTCISGVLRNGSFFSPAFTSVWESDTTYYSISASSSSGGSISPSGSVEVEEGESQTFTYSADDGYAISDVKVNGSSIGGYGETSGSYTLKTSVLPVRYTWSSSRPNAR